MSLIVPMTFIAAAHLDPLVMFELVFPVVHQLGDRRARDRRDLDEVQRGVAGELPSLLDPDDSKLLPAGSDQAYLWGPNAIVDSRFGDLSSRGFVYPSAGFRTDNRGLIESGRVASTPSAGLS